MSESFTIPDAEAKAKTLRDLADLKIQATQTDEQILKAFCDNIRSKILVNIEWIERHIKEREELDETIRKYGEEG